MAPKNIPSASRIWPIDVFPSKEGDYSTPGINLVNLLTVNHTPHILEKTIDDVEGLRRSYPSLIFSESIQPLKYRLYVLPPKKFLLDKRFCVT